MSSTGQMKILSAQCFENGELSFEVLFSSVKLQYELWIVEL